MHIHDTLQSECFKRDPEIAVPEEVAQTSSREVGIVRFDL
jgi:hypothetical protein